MTTAQCIPTVLRRACGSLLVGAAVLAGCGGGGVSVNDTVQAPGAGQWRWELPAHFPVPKVPESNPMSEAKVDLGRHLFYDRRLSGNGTQSCASCHHQDKAFTDGLGTAIGSTGMAHPRGAQGLANVAYHATLTWANPSLVTLEKQMEVPLFGDDPVEMGVNDHNRAEVLARLHAEPVYAAKFAAAFPEAAQPMGWGQVIQAIASFQRTLLSGHSRYDQYLQGKAQLTVPETRGMALFFGEKAECFHCHGSFNFNDQIVHAASRVVETPFHNTGLYNLGGTGAFPEHNRGVFELTALVKDMGAFRAPSLRNVEVTAPYMHDGSVATLEAVLDFYADGGRRIASGPYAGDGRLNPHKSELISLIDLNAQDKSDLVAFLKTLTDHDFLQNPRHSDPWPRR
ncbi:methanobactin export MATE transporter MbnM [Simplicispira metamorpha]|jgi:cytochrome c peroxidase|uniref:Methanobactin biosynthesis cassette protein MbnH n=1 Tax=Simplicispira metamorpha TaxID=80881 RepID=A0A4R2NDA7_9BURK|nr:methanobactin export MATE transporter MbnM [Simplicispira metamorpha]MBP7414468.1 di-heme enzyme [Giesbergeria sp.]MBP8205674.1 di-heme enzyme [Giesbergeria sp.]TCP19058.1 methanobactin biosynthesis cassette protein MbnH [Simplicispira metamorpha]